MVEPRQSRQSRLTEQRQMNRKGERAQSRIRADVAGRPFAADMLLACRQCQDPAAPAGCVDGLSDEAPRHLADEPIAGSEQPDMRSAEIERITKRLALRGNDIGAHLTRRAN